MDTVHNIPPPQQEEEEAENDEWDNDGFVIPSLEISESDETKPHDADDTPHPQPIREEETIYLGPHGAPPSQAKQPDHKVSARKQRLKHKLKEADRKNISETGRENKVDSLRELVGNQNLTSNAPKGSTRDWLDPHCDESLFEKRYTQ
ncbi:hypothetical protein ACFE04_023896 [Oxalis oulophora]